MGKGLFFVLAVATIALAACGDGDDPSGETSGASGATGAIGALAADPAGIREAVSEWYAARREGESQAICMLESVSLQISKYGSEEGCLNDPANNTTQPAFDEQIEFLEVDAGEETAAATVRAKAGDEAETEIGLVAEGGTWRIDSAG